MIDSFVKVKPAGGKGDVVIGKNSIINSGCVLYTENGISIGDCVAIAANCTLAPANHEYQNRRILIRLQRFRQSEGEIIIEDDVWEGANCVILDGAILRKWCVIGAGFLVRGDVGAYSVNVGRPLTRIGYRS